MQGRMIITFLGTGTSDGVPLIACPCATCQSLYKHNKRLRSSVLIQQQASTLLIDASSDFREQALRYRIQQLDAVLFTHADADHTSGIPDLRAINWSMQKSLPIYALKNSYQQQTKPTRWGIDMIYHQYRYAFNNEAGKQGRPSLLYHPISIDKPFSVAGLAIDPLAVWHGDMPIVAYKIGKFAYITDASHIEPATLAQLTNQVEVLVLNAVRHRPHPRHFHLDKAIDVALQIGAGQTYFTHISHDIEHEQVSSSLPKNMHLAFDGLQIKLNE